MFLSISLNIRPFSNPCPVYLLTLVFPLFSCSPNYGLTTHLPAYCTTIYLCFPPYFDSIDVFHLQFYLFSFYYRLLHAISCATINSRQTNFELFKFFMTDVSYIFHLIFSSMPIINDFYLSFFTIHTNLYSDFHFYITYSFIILPHSKLCMKFLFLSLLHILIFILLYTASLFANVKSNISRKEQHNYLPPAY